MRRNSVNYEVRLKLLQYTNQFQFVIIVDGVDELDIQNLDVRSGKPFLPNFYTFMTY